MSRAKMYKVNTEKLRRLLDIAGGPREVSERMQYDQWHFHKVFKRGTISAQAAEKLEMVTKIQLIDYKDDNEFSDRDEHMIRLMTEALRRHDKKKERTKR